MKKIKILYGLEATGGGALKHLVYLATRINKDVFDVTVAISYSRKENSKQELEKLKNSNVRIIFVPMVRSLNLVKDVYNIIRIMLIIKSGNFDIIHAHSSKAGALFRIAAFLCHHKNVLYTPHCFFFQGKQKLKRTFFLFIEKVLAKITTGIIVSDEEKHEIIHTHLVEERKIININNAIDFNEYRQLKKVKEVKFSFGLPEDCTVVAAIGRLSAQKDYITFLYAAKKVLKYYPATRFLIVGEGNLYQKISNTIDKLNLKGKVILTGNIHEIHSIYCITDIIVNTSLWEGLPYVFLEAMKYKKPIVATQSTSIINEKTGFICKTKDYSAVSQKIIKLIENYQLRLTLGRNGYNLLIQKYSFKNFIQEHEDLYKNLVPVYL